LFNLAVADFEVVFDTREEFKRFLWEVQSDPMNNEMRQKLSVFKEIEGVTSRGDPYRAGVISRAEAHHLYAILRKKKPEIVVETGVGNGHSTAFILLALEKNNQGKLYSIDFPEVAGEKYEVGTFWEGKGGAVVPPSKESGWLVPERLGHRWKLILGKSQEKLPTLVKELAFIDVFLHDSEHSYGCQMFEFEQVWAKIKKGGLLFSHDIHRNNSFFDFAKKKNREPHYIKYNFGFLIK